MTKGVRTRSFFYIFSYNLGALGLIKIFVDNSVKIKGSLQEIQLFNCMKPIPWVQSYNACN